MKSFPLEVITQEKPLLDTTAKSITVMTQTGQITVLSDHVPLFSKLMPGELTYRSNTDTSHFMVTGGFIDISPDNKVTILADSAIRSDKINLQKVQAAIKNAQKALEESKDDKTTLKIELELRHATIQANIAQKRHGASA